MVRRRSIARPSLAIVLAAALAGCGSSAPTASTGAAKPTAALPAGASDAPSGVPGSAAIEPSAAPTSIAGSQVPASEAPPSVEPSGSIGPGPSATTAASAWRTVVPPLLVPAAYLDFGFAGNGDLIVVATDDITDAKLGLWIARYSLDGTRKSKKTVDRRITRYAGDWIDIDPTNDSVVISERDAPLTTYTGRRVSSATGKTMQSIDFHREVRRIAIDDAGRIFAITPFYGSAVRNRACIIDRLGAAGGIATGVDNYLETCEVRGITPPPAIFGSPLTIEVGRDGRLLILDDAGTGERRHAEPAGPALTVLTRGFAFVRHWHIPLEWSEGDPPYGTWTQSMTVAGSGDGDVYIGELILSDDGTHSTGYRVRAFDMAGKLVTTYGTGGNQVGVTWPTAPNVGADGRLWVIDLDTATRSYSIKVLDE